MKYCIRCVNVDTRPDTGAFENGICPACRFAEERKKQVVDFRQRRKELDGIIQWGKENTKSSYDCIVTVSGGKDSTRQAFFVRDELGLKPLLVNSSYPPEQLHERGAHNLGNLISHGFDTVSLGLNPQVWKELMRQAFFRFGNHAIATELPLYAIPIHVAIAYKIPLIFLGENPLYTIGQQEGKTVGGNALGMQYSNTLKGGSPDRLLTPEITPQDVHFYRYPSDDEIEHAKLRIIYLGYYIEDWSDRNNAEFSIQKGLKIREESLEQTGGLTHTGLDEEFYMVNQMIKYIKFGFGLMTDRLVADINEGRIDRKTAFEEVRKYDGKCDQKYIDAFCKYLDITKEKFWEVVESYRGKHVWGKDQNNEWKLKIED